MKIYHVFYSERGSWGYYVEYEYVVVAESPQEAIDLAERNADDAKDPTSWHAEEIPFERGATYISSSRS